MELEKRGVFSHENVEPLIGLLTDLHRVDIINTCGVREYKERAERASEWHFVVLRSTSCMYLQRRERNTKRKREREGGGGGGGGERITCCTSSH